MAKRHMLKKQVNQSVKNRQSKEFKDFVIKEKELSYFFGLFLDSQETLKSKECFDFGVFPSLMFVLSERKEDFLHQYLSALISELKNTGYFNTSKIESAYLRGNTDEVEKEIQKIFERFYLKSKNEGFLLYIQTVYCLFNYFDYYKNTKEAGNEFVDYNLFTFCQAYALLMELTKNKKRVEDKKTTEIEKNVISSDKIKEIEKKVISLKFTDSIITYPCSENRKVEFVSLINDLLEIWRNVDYKEQRNKISCIDWSKYNLDWSGLFNSFDTEIEGFKNIYPDIVKSVSAHSLTSLRDMLKSSNFEDGNIEEVKVAYSQFILVGKGNIKFFYSYCVLNLIMQINSELLKNVIKVRDETNLLNTNNIKDLKSTNRTLTKNLKALEVQLNEAQKQVDENREKLESFELNEKQSKELTETTEKLHKTEQTFVELKESIKKVQNKLDWSENRVLELEHSLKYYDSLEGDLLNLQNENNILTSQIEEIERLESLENPEEEYLKKLDVIKDEPILFIGGVGNMISKFMEQFPNSEYIDISDMGTNFIIPPRIKYVAIYTRVVTHSHCRRAESLISKDRIIPLNIFNTKLVVDELYKNIVGHKNSM